MDAALGRKKPTEKQFQQMVLQLAKLHGWRTAHFRPAMQRDGKWVTAVAGDGKGFPDTVLVKGGRLIFAELKVGRNKPTAEQRLWLAALGAVPGVTAALWTPADWDAIETVLGAK